MGDEARVIKYALQCEQGHSFEGWFRNSQDFQDQLDGGHMQCPLCGSLSVSKALMAPSVSGTRSQNAQELAGDNREVALQPSSEQQQQITDMLRQVRKHVVDNSDYVGDKFAEEARRIHFNEVEARGIYGEATTEEVKSLVEDGVDCLPLPNLPEDKN